MIKDESGASAAEYALILAIVGTGIAIAALHPWRRHRQRDEQRVELHHHAGEPTATLAELIVVAAVLSGRPPYQLSS